MKFSIRDLLLVTLIVALALGWWLHHRAWKEKYSDKAAESEIWKARTEEMQARSEMLVELLRAQPTPVSSISTPNRPTASP